MKCTGKSNRFVNEYEMLHFCPHSSEGKCQHGSQKKQQPETGRMKNCVQEHGKKDGQFMFPETWMSRSAVITNCETVLLYMSESKKKG